MGRRYTKSRYERLCALHPRAKYVVDAFIGYEMSVTSSTWTNMLAQLNDTGGLPRLERAIRKVVRLL